ncbi:MAG TPA: thermonuclease family protein [Devosia sp.]|nr:thermonuclease family protein [Devosia sp.]
MYVVNMKFRFPSFGRKLSGFLNAFLLIAALVAAIYLLPGSDNVLSGHARASDGDSLRLGEERIRILGIDAPELDQTCTNQSGTDWACGRASKEYLVQALARGPVKCIWDARDKYGRILATCDIDGQDIGAMMIKAGMAVSYYDYRAEETVARSQHVGIWSGDFLTPRQWRDGQRNGEQPADIWGNMWSWVTGWFT